MFRVIRGGIVAVLLAACALPAAASEAVHDVTLLQRKFTLKPDELPVEVGQVGQAGPLPQEQQLVERAHPVAWVHVPKTGSTLFNALVRVPGMCRQPVIEKYWDVDISAMLKEWNEGVPGVELFNVSAACPGGFTSFGHRIHPEFVQCAHIGVGGDLWEAYAAGHAVTMLRQPEQRLLSGFYDNQHSWPTYHYNRSATSAKEYAEVIRGCAVRMLTRPGGSNCLLPFGTAYTPCGDPIPATEQETQLAIERLRSGFLFVGIQEQWDLSICLFHKIFGGACSATEFGNSRPGDQSGDDSAYDLAPLGGVIDVADRRLYAEAQALFSASLRRYNVTRSSCQPCFQQAAA